MSNPLEGKTITGVKIARDDSAILLETTDGDIAAQAEGDCCSITWIEDVSLPALGFPANVISAEVLNLPFPEEQPDYGETKAYGFKVETDKGRLNIEYRNESNGYYGGSLAWPGEWGHYPAEIAKTNWVEVEE